MVERFLVANKKKKNFVNEYRHLISTPHFYLFRRGERKYLFKSFKSKKKKKSGKFFFLSYMRAAVDLFFKKKKKIPVFFVLDCENPRNIGNCQNKKIKILNFCEKKKMKKLNFSKL